MPRFGRAPVQILEWAIGCRWYTAHFLPTVVELCRCDREVLFRIGISLLTSPIIEGTGLIESQRFKVTGPCLVCFVHIFNANFQVASQGRFSTMTSQIVSLSTAHLVKCFVPNDFLASAHVRCRCPCLRLRILVNSYPILCHISISLQLLLD